MSEGGYIGSKISLISRSDIRYVGILHHLNPTDSTVALEQVKSYGTEGRRGNPAEEIPPNDNIFEYIVFRGSDVKDLHVCEPPAPQPPARPQVPDDPAILGTTAPPSYYNQHSQAPPAGYYQQQQPQQPAQAQYQQAPQTSQEETKAKVAEKAQDQHGKSDSDTIKPAPPPARSTPKTQPQELRKSVEILAKQVSELNVSKDATEPSAHQETDNRYSSRLPGMGGHLLNSNSNRRGGRGGRGGAHGAMNSTRAPAVPTSDFDFETSNAKFHKDELAKEVGKTEEHAEEEEEEEIIIPQAEEFYDRSKSFFDNISCETKERMNKAEAQNQGGNRLSVPERRAKQSEERQLNLETFGQTSVDQGRFRGGYRGGYRGNYRNGPRGGGGYRGGYSHHHNSSGGMGYNQRGGYYNNSGYQHHQQQHHQHHQQQQQQQQQPHQQQQA
ncbi:protein LSM14 [Entomortierella parvispora]|uniref:Protein LSM14 n=1 Tax=Entomortierella parvispora TaxID=205924 RepID=A0A9P3H5B3_9FUNG|nr:protein LSM14 [Entomortierella parvispora]